MTEIREKENRPVDRSSTRSVKLPGETRHSQTTKSAKEIARLLIMSKRGRKAIG